MIEFEMVWANPDSGEAGTVKGHIDAARALISYKVWPAFNGEEKYQGSAVRLVRGAMAQVAFQDLTGLRPAKWPMRLYARFGKYPFPVLHFRPDHMRIWAAGKGRDRHYLMTNEPYEREFDKEGWDDPGRYAKWAMGWNFRVFDRGIGLWNPNRRPGATRFVLCSPPDVGVDLAEIGERLKGFPYFDEFEIEHTPRPFPAWLRRSA
ncbi:MAG: hypothetical protein ACREPG_02280 [Candidatus Binatia bacterium]